MPARLNRRRYREAVTCLKEVIADKKNPAVRRIRAVETLLGIYDRHDRHEARRNARKIKGISEGTEELPAAQEEPSAGEKAAAFLETMRQKGIALE